MLRLIPIILCVNIVENQAFRDERVKSVRTEFIPDRLFMMCKDTHSKSFGRYRMIFGRFRNTMLDITRSASKTIREIVDREKTVSPIRIMMAGGCVGPRLGMLFDWPGRTIKSLKWKEFNS